MYYLGDSLPDPMLNKPAFEAALLRMSKPQLFEAMRSTTNPLKQLGIAILLQQKFGVSAAEARAAGLPNVKGDAPVTTSSTTQGGGIGCGLANVLLFGVGGAILGAVIPGATYKQGAMLGALTGFTLGVTGIKPCTITTTRSA